MSGNTSLRDSKSPQMIIENLACKRITQAEAERSLQRQWGRAYDTPTVIRLIREIFKDGSARRVSK
jgi:hypothetical protein